MEKFVYTLIWQSITIEITYWPLKWNTISKLEIRSIAPTDAPLPITNTGYKSDFFQPSSTPRSKADIIASVQSWLDEEAAKPAWQDFVEANKQGELF